MSKTLCIINKESYPGIFGRIGQVVHVHQEGPGILPWGTPEITGRGVDKVLLILTICDLFDK